MAFNKNKVMDTARKCAEKGQVDRAIKEYLRIVTEDPSDVRVWLKIGDLYVKKGAKREATETYQRVANFYSEQGFYLKAVAVYKQILRLNPRRVDINLKLAELYRQLGLLSDAMQRFEMVAGYFHREGKTTEALATLRQLVDLDPENVATRIKLAELYSKEGLVEEAVAEFSRACDYLRANNRESDFVKVAERLLWHKADNIDLSRELAILYLRRSDARRALQKLRVCFQANSRDVQTLELLAQAFQALDQKAKTVSVLKEMARVLDEDGKRERAADVHRRILSLVPGDTDSLGYLGQGDAQPPEHAGKAPRQSRPLTMSAVPPRESRAKAPTGSVPLIDDRNAQAFLRSTGALTGSSSGADVVPLSPGNRGNSPSYETSIDGEANSEQIDQILTESDVYVKYGLHQQAIEHLQRVFALDAANVEARERLKDIYWSLGREDETVGELMRLLEMSASSDPGRAQTYLHELLRIRVNYQPALELARRLGVASGGEEKTSVTSYGPARSESIEQSLDMEDIEILDSDGEGAIAPEDGLGDTREQPRYSLSEMASSSDMEEEFFLEEISEPDESLDTTVMVIDEVPRETDEMPVPPHASQGATIPSQALSSQALASETLQNETVQHATIIDSHEEGTQQVDFASELAAELFAPTDEDDFEGAAAEFDGATQIFDLDPDDAKVFGAEPMSDMDDPFVTAPTADDDPEVLETREIDDIPDAVDAMFADLGEIDAGDFVEGASNKTVDIRFGSARRRPSGGRPSRGIDDDLDEADAYTAQGQYAEARDILNGLLESHPNHPLLMAKIQEINELESAGGAFTGSDAALYLDIGSGGSSGPDAGTRDAGGDKALSRPAVTLEKPVEDEDAETHYDLGLAYKEMGLYEEAIKAFEKALRISSREVQCQLMIGLCYREHGDALSAINHFKAGLHVPGIVLREQLSLYYEIAISYETELEDLHEAQYFFELIRKKDSEYRDVTRRMEAIKRRMSRPGGAGRNESADDVDAIDSLLAESERSSRRGG